MIDEIPAVCALAAVAKGTTEIRDAVTAADSPGPTTTLPLASRRAFLQISALAGRGSGERMAASFNVRALPELGVRARSDNPYDPLIGFLQQYPGRVLLVAETAGRREVLQGVLREHGMSTGMASS